MSNTPLTLADFEQLLDVHGTARERWPSAAWESAARLVAESAAARTLWDESAALDRALGALPPIEPTAALVDRVLALAPQRWRAVSLWRSSRWQRAAAAALPLAAAAGVALWLAGGTGFRSTPAASALTSLAVGEYESPTDYLLDSYGVDVSENVPSVGCTDSTLGCPSLDDDAGARSQA